MFYLPAVILAFSLSAFPPLENGGPSRCLPSHVRYSFIIAVLESTTHSTASLPLLCRLYNTHLLEKVARPARSIPPRTTYPTLDTLQTSQLVPLCSPARARARARARAASKQASKAYLYQFTTYCFVGVILSLVCARQTPRRRHVVSPPCNARPRRNKVLICYVPTAYSLLLHGIRPRLHITMQLQMDRRCP